MHYRKTMLNYCRKTDYNYYKWVLAEYGLPEEVPFNAHHKDFNNYYVNHGNMGLRRGKIYHL